MFNLLSWTAVLFHRNAYIIHECISNFNDYFCILAADLEKIHKIYNGIFRFAYPSALWPPKSSEFLRFLPKKRAAPASAARNLFISVTQSVSIL